MNWKLILIGGVLFYVATWIVSMFTGPLLHEGLLAESYDAHAGFWRPELNEEPPNMTALLPRWITAGLIGSFIVAGIYGILRPAFRGAGWLRGVKYGVVLFLVVATTMLGWSGVFNLPDSIWVWWSLESLLYYLAGGAVLGWIADKVAPATT